MSYIAWYLIFLARALDIFRCIQYFPGSGQFYNQEFPNVCESRPPDPISSPFTLPTFHALDGPLA